METIMSLFSGQHFWQTLLVLLLLNFITLLIASYLATRKSRRGKAVEKT